jgi:hypothetical protein
MPFSSTNLAYGYAHALCKDVCSKMFALLLFIIAKNVSNLDDHQSETYSIDYCLIHSRTLYSRLRKEIDLFVLKWNALQDTSAVNFKKARDARDVAQ